MLAVSQYDSPSWPVLAAVLTGFLAVCYLLPTPRRRPAHWGLLGIVLALAGFAVYLRNGLGRTIPLNVESVLFGSFALLAVLFAILMIVQRNPARSAVYFAVVVLNVCGLFLLQGAPFLTAATIIIYAGAIIVTFLFVIMLSRFAGPADENDRSREPPLAAAAGFVVLATLLIGLERVYDTSEIDRLLAQSARWAEADAVDPVLKDVQSSDVFVADLKRVRERFGFGDGISSRQPPWVREQMEQLRDAADDLASEVGPSIALDTQRDLSKRIRVSLAFLKGLRDGSVSPGWDLQLSPYSQVRPAVEGRPQPKRLPSGNVAALGRSLFTDHLIAVELGGTLLLVATIGAIAIAGGRRRGSAEA